MKKKLLAFAITTTLVLSLAACKKAAPASEVPSAEPIVLNPDQGTVVTSEVLTSETIVPETVTSETPEVVAETGRADGERFETTIILEGMEETVSYEHIKNDAAGFEMDYDYESFARTSGNTEEKFVSVYDDAAKPENYLTVSYKDETVDSVIESLKGELEKYEFEVQDITLEKAGACKRIPVEVLKGTNEMIDQLQMIYLIPAGNGCIVATEHYAIEASEGFGRRFSYMLNTLTVTK